MKLLVQTAQTGVVTDFYNYLQHNPVNEHFDIKARVLEFTTTLETDTRQREQTNNFLFAQYDAKGYGRTGRWIQCAYCKIWYPRHMTLPMIPAADIDNWKTLHHNLCFSCTRSSLDNQLLHPGQWLNVQEPPDFQVGEHTQLQAGSPDLTQTANRPAVLRTLDQENNPEHWVPHHWTLALPTTADVTYDAFILHYWSTTQLRWFRTPLANPKSDQYENPQPLTLSQFLSMATRSGRRENTTADKSSLHDHGWLSTTTCYNKQRNKIPQHRIHIYDASQPPAGVHLQLVHTFRLPHGPKAQGPTSHSPDEVARDTCRTSADRGEPPKSLHTKPRFYRTPERMVGCHHTLPLQPFPLQESKLQISDTELTLVTHHGQQLPETRGLLMPKMP